jgi:hypothetical protein
MKRRACECERSVGAQPLFPWPGSDASLSLPLKINDFSKTWGHRRLCRSVLSLALRWSCRDVGRTGALAKWRCNWTVGICFFAERQSAEGLE